MQRTYHAPRVTARCGLLALFVVAGCATAPPAGTPPAERRIPIAGTPEASRQPALPPIPEADAPLRLEVGYPRADAPVTASDSNFIFGSTGSGRTQLTINGAVVPVAPNGGFLAFIPVPADGVYRLRATRNGDTASLEHVVRVPGAAAQPRAGAWITSPYPAGAWAVQAGEHVEVGFRGPAGGRAALLLPTGDRVVLSEQRASVEPPPGEQFLADAPTPATVAAVSRYAAIVPLTVPLASRDTAIARPGIGRRHDAGPAGSPASFQDAVIELVLGADTARVPLPLNAAVLPAGPPRAAVVTAPAGAAHDWTTRGRIDVTGPFHYFWPHGTRLSITGERGGMYRVRLAANRTAWVPVDDVRLLPEGSPPPGGAINSARFSPQPEWIDLRIPTPERLPFQVMVEDRTLRIDVFGAISRANFFQHGAVDPLLAHAEWTQVADSIFRVTMQLDRPVWGYHTFFDATGAIVLRIRRPPVLDPAAPLRGVTVVVDPGHGGADRATRGPTGLTEADANLAIALRLRAALEDEGARVIMTRETDVTVPLGDRPRLAADSGAHVLVSVHNNAFPDGVNPWLNNGTSTYYNQQQSAELARLMQLELLDELGLRDIGYGRADLALVRPTWMPAVLTETMFMMIPEHESALREPAVHERIAQAHVRALAAFLRQRSLP